MRRADLNQGEDECEWGGWEKPVGALAVAAATEGRGGGWAGELRGLGHKGLSTWWELVLPSVSLELTG